MAEGQGGSHTPERDDVVTLWRDGRSGELTAFRRWSSLKDPERYVPLSVLEAAESENVKLRDQLETSRYVSDCIDNRLRAAESDRARLQGENERLRELLSDLDFLCDYAGEARACIEGAGEWTDDHWREDALAKVDAKIALLSGGGLDKEEP